MQRSTPPEELPGTALTSSSARPPGSHPSDPRASRQVGNKSTEFTASDERWTARRGGLRFDGQQNSIGYIMEGTVPKTVLSGLLDVASSSEGTVSAETGLDNTPPSTFEGFDGHGWPESYFDAVESIAPNKAKAIEDWAVWARWLARETLDLERVTPAVGATGRPFPPAILRRTCAGIAPHVDAASEEYPGTTLDLGEGAVQWSVIGYLSNHDGDQGSLIVYDSQPLRDGRSTVSYPLDRPSDHISRMAIRPLQARTVIVRSDHVHEVLPTAVPRLFVTMFVIVANDGTAVSAG